MGRYEWGPAAAAILAREDAVVQLPAGMGAVAGGVGACISEGAVRDGVDTGVGRCLCECD